MKVIRFDGWTLQKVNGNAAISTDFDSVPQ